MDCTQAQDEFAALLDGELDPEERAAVEGHLSQCSDCLRELDGLKRVDTLYRQLSAVAAPDGLEERVRREIRSSAILRFPGLSRPRRRLWPVLATAAAVLLLVAGAVVVEFGFPVQEMRMASLAKDTVASAPQAMPPALEKMKATLEDRGQAKEVPVSVESQRYAGSGAGADKDIATPSTEVQIAPPAPPELKQEAPDGAIRTFGAASAPEDMAAAPMAAPAPMAIASENANFNAARSVAKKGVSEVEEVGKRAFVLKNGVWYESGYTEQDTILLTRSSKGLRKLIAVEPDLGKVLELGERIVFKVDETWYRVGPKVAKTKE